MTDTAQIPSDKPSHIADANNMTPPPKPVSYPKPTEQQLKDIEQKIQVLEKAFTRIQHENMHDVPILNDKIKVTAVGFRLWQDSYIGIMVTPWFMNLMLLPLEIDDWDELAELSKKTHSFPSGQYTFITGYEFDIGKYQMCSLFSPMFEFADHDAAIETAEVAMTELLNHENVEQTDIDSELIEDIWDGSQPHPDHMDAEDTLKTLNDEQKKEILEQKTMTEKLETPISRRQMLRGKFFGEEDQT